jgi:hypothetical protein
MASEFAEELRRLRTQRGLSVRELAAFAHCGKSHVHDLETSATSARAHAAREHSPVGLHWPHEPVARSGSSPSSCCRIT